MFNNFNKQPNTVSEQGAGVFNQFVAPIASDEITPKKDTVKVFLMIALLIVVMVAVAAFLYLRVLAGEVKQKEVRLASYDTTPTLIQFEGQLPEMRLLSQRLKLLNSVYDSRMYVSQMMFPILETTVESSSDSYVYFNKFSLKKQINSNLASLSMGGMALDYPTLYRQLNNFKSGTYSQYIKNFKLVNFSLNERGTVEFDITFDIDISTSAFLEYLSLLNPNFEANMMNASGRGPLYNIPPTPTDTSTSSNSGADNSLSSQISTSNPGNANPNTNTNPGNANNNSSNQTPPPTNNNTQNPGNGGDVPVIIISD